MTEVLILKIVVSICLVSIVLAWLNLDNKFGTFLIWTMYVSATTIVLVLIWGGIPTP